MILWVMAHPKEEQDTLVVKRDLMALKIVRQKTQTLRASKGQLATIIRSVSNNFSIMAEPLQQLSRNEVKPKEK